MSRIRVLHVVGGLVRGGAETWLLHLARRIDRERFQLDFLVHTSKEGAYDPAIRALGSRILVCPDPRRPWSYARGLRRLLREEGPYDIVHSHVHHYSGYVLRVAAGARVPVRIAHSHNDLSAQHAAAGFLRRCYLELMKRWVERYASVGLAASAKAAASLFGPAWESDIRWRRYYCSIDLRPFSASVDSGAVRKELGIPATAKVVGHVGSFTSQKNHRFIVRIAAELVRLEPRAHLLLVGAGPLRSSVERQVREEGLEKRVTFAGLRDDVPRLLIGAVDIFLFPSLYEGLPVSLLEAQAAGVPVVVSDVVTGEVDVVEALIHRMPLAESAARWAALVRQVLVNGARVPRPDAITAIRRSAFDVDRGTQELEAIYSTLMQSATPDRSRRRVLLPKWIGG